MDKGDEKFPADSRGEKWRQATRLLHGGEPDKALVFFEQVIGENAEDYECWLSIGYCHSILSDWDGAVEAYSQAIKLQPDTADPYVRRGGVRFKQEMWEEASQDFVQACTLTPDDALIFCNLALALGQLGKLEEARDAVRKALELRPEFAFAHYELGWIFSQLEQWQEAAEAFRKAVAIEPEFAKAHYNLGVNYLVLGDLKSAMAELDILKGLNQDMADHLWQLMQK